MRRAAQNTALVAVGGAMLWITLATREYVDYVRPGFWPLVVATGVVLCGLGVAGVVVDLRRGADSAEHGHDHGFRMAWLLLAPPVAIFVVAPSALGAFTAARETDRAPVPSARSFKNLTATGPAVMPIGEFIGRAFAVRAGHDTLTGRPVRLTGFVVPRAGGWLVVRLEMTCCAADTVPMRVVVVSAPAPASDSWVQVTGTLAPARAKFHGIDVPELTVTNLTHIPAPSDPYE